LAVYFSNHLFILTNIKTDKLIFSYFEYSGEDRTTPFPVSKKLLTYEIRLDRATKMFSGHGGSEENIISAYDNSIANNLIPDAAGKQIIRALNLRKTQDMIANVYDATATYAYGDYCIYQNDFYKCTTAITSAEAWNSSHWTKMTLADASNEDDIEIIDYQSNTPLTDAQVKKAKEGKLVVKGN
jgi:hypothetical protein